MQCKEGRKGGRRRRFLLKRRGYSGTAASLIQLIGGTCGGVVRLDTFKEWKSDEAKASFSPCSAIKHVGRPELHNYSS